MVRRGGGKRKLHINTTKKASKNAPTLGNSKHFNFKPKLKVNTTKKAHNNAPKLNKRLNSTKKF